MRTDHGYQRYSSNTDPCRCDVCRAAKADYMRRRRAAARLIARKHTRRHPLRRLHRPPRHPLRLRGSRMQVLRLHRRPHGLRAPLPPPLQEPGGPSVTTPPRTCTTCGRTMRGRRDPETAGDVIHQARGLCSRCYMDVRKAEGYVQPRRKRPKEAPAEVTIVGRCNDCQRLMVPSSTKAPDKPAGTVRHAGKDMCDNCRQRQQREAARDAALAIRGNTHDTTWMTRAACAQVGPVDQYYFPDKGHTTEPAKRVCNTVCEVKDACLAYALRTREPYGVWGGASPDERKKMLRGIEAA